jgi:predicted Zn-dependent protease with MMP-like domain
VRRAEFERLVTRALDELPPAFAGRLRNVAVLVEARPSPEVAAELGGDILGLYHGRSEIEQSPITPYELPEVIILYQKNIEAICRTRDEVVEEVRKTVIHEIGHHFGLSDEEMEALERDAGGR